MVRDQIAAQGVRDERVLEAMRRVPRHEFVPSRSASLAYQDGPLPIGQEQTISQPFIVAYMTEQLELRGNERVLEIGTGCGYQTAILGQLAREVTSVEIVGPLVREAADRLRRFGYRNLRILHGDGSTGYEPDAPYDAIIVTASAPKGIEPLQAQLKPGGRLVAPVGPAFGAQQLIRVDRDANGECRRQELLAVRFVPLTGAGG